MKKTTKAAAGSSALFILVMCVVGCLPRGPVVSFIENNTKVQTPEYFREPGETKKLPLPEARVVYSVRTGEAAENTTLWAENIRRGNESVEFWVGLYDGLKADIADGTLPIDIPVWSVLGGSSIGSWLFGWLGFRRPGDRTQEEADDLYDEGLSVGTKVKGEES